MLTKLIKNIIILTDIILLILKRYHPFISIGISTTAGISQKLVVSGNNFSVHSGMGRKRSDDKKTCRWVLDNGTICGRSFSKFDSLRRHVQELHKGMNY